jgi:hypothetical protein
MFNTLVLVPNVVSGEIDVFPADRYPSHAAAPQQPVRCTRGSLNKESSGELSFSSGSSRAPSPMEKALPRRKHNFVREQTNDDDDKHDADNLVHGI